MARLRPLACFLFAFFLLHFALPARADDLLERQRQLHQIADRRAEDLVRRGVQQADLLARTSPAEAEKALRGLLTALDLDGAVSAQTRLALVNQIQGKIAALTGAPAAGPDAKLVKLRADQRKAVEAGLAEAAEVKATVAEVAKLYEAGKAAEARQKAVALAKKYPANPAVIVLDGQGALSDRLAESRALAREQVDRFTIALNDVQRSALPARKDMELAPDWKQRQELRKRLEPRLGPDEERILAALEKPIGPGITNQPLEEALQSLATLTGVPLYLDDLSLEAAGADKRRPATSPPGVSARTALRAVLQSQGLTFVIRDKAVVVVSLEKARESLVSRSYYLGDAVAAPFGGGVGLGPILDAQQVQANAQFIIDGIMKGVDPLVWQAKGGPATIVFHYPSLSLMVRAPAEVQAGLAARLK
jgi:hypothetical protein